MSLKKEYHGENKLNRGPGGWRCPCCSWGPPRKVKPMAHRLARRKAKAALSKVVPE